MRLRQRQYLVSMVGFSEISATHFVISDEKAMMSPSIEPVLGFPEAVNPRARASLSSDAANSVWMATTGGNVIHYIQNKG